MKEYNKDGIKFEYKSALNEDDFNTIINTYIDVYNNGLDYQDNIEGFHKNPIMAERAFNISIGNLCIKNYNKELHETLFDNGIYSFLKDDIINLKEAYSLAREICNKIDTPSELIYQFLNKVINLIPSEIDVEKLQKTWNDVIGEYNKTIEKE